jgi:predicted nuclease of predicted toxin-antitoxin system
MTTRQKRYKLLLDEMLPRKDKYPLLNNYHNVRHIVHDLKKEGITDLELIRLASRTGRIVITKNIKHLKELGLKYQVDIIGVTEILPPERMDNKIVAILRRRTYKNMTGRFIKVAN